MFASKRYLISCALLLALTACVSPPKPSTKQPNTSHLKLIQQAEQQSTGRTQAVLAQARKMTLVKPEIIKGGCWDYLDTAWTRAGVPRQDRKVVFTGNKSGNYADPDQLQAGDWIYHINYSYHNIEHSGMFIGWVDKAQNLGLTLSYAGEKRKEPARYKVYDLSGVYQITRAQ